MTNEEKLKQLFTIAVENGWDCANFRSSDCIEHWLSTPSNQSEYSIEGITLVCYPASSWSTEFVSINDVILNYESDGSLRSFIDALFMAVTIKFHGTHELMIPFIFRQQYSNKPTSERLAYLFEVYSCLLN